MLVRKTIKIDEAADQCGIEIHVITQWIQKEWIMLAAPQEQILDQEDLARIRFIKNLIDDFGVNEEGIPIILHLVDQLYHLHDKAYEFSLDQRK